MSEGGAPQTEAHPGWLAGRTEGQDVQREEVRAAPWLQEWFRRTMTWKVPLNAYGKPMAWYHRWLWRCSRVVARLLGGPRAPTGDPIPRDGPVVVIAPHLSFFDPLFLHAALPRPSRFLAAAYFVAKNAPLSWLLYLAGVVPVRRHRRDALALRQALRLLAAGEMVTFFPEGGRTWTGLPNLPMTAAVKFLLGLKVPIYVATVDGSYDYWPRFAPAPRPRGVRVRISGPLTLARGCPPPSRRPEATGRPWWAEVYTAGRRREVCDAAEAIRCLFAATAAEEPARLRLEIPGRLAALTRILCFCPECAAAPLAWDGSSLGCPACGVAFRLAGSGRLRRVPAQEGAVPDASLPELVSRMRSRLEARAGRGFSLEDSVEAAEVRPESLDAGAIPFAPASARLDETGLQLMAGGRPVHLPLRAVAAASVMGSETLEMAHPGRGTVVYLRSGAGAMRILLAARAFLRLPFEAMNL